MNYVSQVYYITMYCFVQSLVYMSYYGENIVFEIDR